jgi:cytochrome c oxidase assembly protein subunit 15
MSEAVTPARRTFLRDEVPARAVPYIRIWLLAIAVMVYAMILVGGATRLTDSGLSITEWRPLLGAIPPMNDADWADAFAKYRSMTAQFHQINSDMTVDSFKGIYWWEWGHRELGRTIGVVFALPFLTFLGLRMVSRKLFPHLVALFVLGGLQGLVGWWMVSSGVNSDLTSVAPYRLMFHFCLALFIIAYAFWLWLDLGATRDKDTPKAAYGWASALVWIAGVQMALGALVAGLDAGRGYIDWPLMNGQVIPQAMWALEPWWKNVTENPATTQFLHRITAYTLLVVAAIAAWRFRKTAPDFVVLAALVLAQASLGVLTLMNAAPVNLSLLHQALGTIVLLATVRVVWKTVPSSGSAPSPAA